MYLILGRNVSRKGSERMNKRKKKKALSKSANLKKPYKGIDPLNDFVSIIHHSVLTAIRDIDAKFQR